MDDQWKIVINPKFFHKYTLEELIKILQALIINVEYQVVYYPLKGISYEDCCIYLN